MEKTLIDWKTDAWKNPDMVAWYHQRMVENRGTSRLKNQVEADLCERYVLGPRLLDVGIGTGRGSLPLARAGFEVTGVDSSQAMLDQTRKLAGDTPIQLRQGDLGDLKFADGEFDGVMSLNVLVHFPNWREILAEWHRVARPGGRILFDIHSQDHEDAACAAKGLPPRPEGLGEDYLGYMSRIRVADLVETVNRLGQRIEAVVPYAGIFAGGNINLWLKDTLAEGTRYDRLLSWLISDPALLAFALFLEQEVFAHLTTRVTGRMMVVLDNRPDVAGNLAWLERDERLNAALARGVYADIAGLVPAFDQDWQQRLNQHLDHPRNRVLLHFLLSAWREFPGRLDLASFLDERHAVTLEDWRRQDELDRLVTRIPRALAALPEVAGILNYKGVPLMGGQDYELTRNLLSKTFHAFD
ncbi:MAG: class I SAM-dependent methyltransferase [Gammaproteobacteria bacterium]|nr:class I SAM-dependent methyltransferase [Gammaproteobacteria bacterium]